VPQQNRVFLLMPFYFQQISKVCFFCFHFLELILHHLTKPCDFKFVFQSSGIQNKQPKIMGHPLHNVWKTCGETWSVFRLQLAEKCLLTNTCFLAPGYQKNAKNQDIWIIYLDGMWTKKILSLVRFSEWKVWILSLIDKWKWADLLWSQNRKIQTKERSTPTIFLVHQKLFLWW
jgi:hypothetical protein